MPSNVTKIPFIGAASGSRRGRSALAEAAGAALEAPFLPLDLAAAVGAGAAGDLLLLGGKGRILRRGPGGLGDGLREAGEHRLEVFEVPLDRLRHGVGAGEDLAAVAAPGGEVAGDPLQLL